MNGNHGLRHPMSDAVRILLSVDLQLFVGTAMMTWHEAPGGRGSAQVLGIGVCCLAGLPLQQTPARDAGLSRVWQHPLSTRGMGVMLQTVA